MKIDGVRVYVHWSVFAISAFILLQAFQRPALSFVGLLCYYSVLLLHESGHMVVARRKGCDVDRIELYPIFGLTHFSNPWSEFDHQVIAWGGVMAQALIAILLMLWIAIFGYTKFEALNAALVILGYFSFGVALFNLLPFRPLDGSIAWGIIPALLRRRSRSRDKDSYSSSRR
jgi:stage IV sporulation protein FB